jgi:hypothetical protein
MAEQDIQLKEVGWEQSVYMRWLVLMAIFILALSACAPVEATQPKVEVWTQGCSITEADLELLNESAEFRSSILSRIMCENTLEGLETVFGRPVEYAGHLPEQGNELELKKGIAYVVTLDSNMVNGGAEWGYQATGGSVLYPGAVRVEDEVGFRLELLSNEGYGLEGDRVLPIVWSREFLNGGIPMLIVVPAENTSVDIWPLDDSQQAVLPFDGVGNFS